MSMGYSLVTTGVVVATAFILSPECACTCSAAAATLEDDIASPPPPAVKCESEEDLDFTSCDLKHLSKEALRSICTRVGLDLEEHIFPILDAEIGGIDDDYDEDDDGDASRPKVERSREEYIWAAHECLLIENEVDEMEDEDPELLEELEMAMLEEDPALLAEVVKEVLESNPTLLEDLEEELKREDPEQYRAMIEELSEGESLIDRPELVADLISLMLAENPDMALVDEIDDHIVHDGDGDDPDDSGGAPRAGKEEL